jgi:hypothetical protein
MIEIKEIFSKNELKEFIKFPFELYKDNKYWVPPIIHEELESFDKTKNPVFKTADTHFYLAYKNSKIVGRVVAIINWDEVNIFEFNDRLDYIFQNICDCFYDRYPYGTLFNPTIIKNGNHYDITYMEFCVSFTVSSLNKWTGNYEYLDGNNWLLSKDVYCKQLLNDNRIIKSQEFNNWV